MYIFLHILKMQMNICLREKNLDCLRGRLRTPTRTVKYQVNSLRSCIRSSLEYMRLVIQKKKRCSFVYSVKTDAFTSKGTDEVRAREVLDFNDDVGGLRVSKTDDRNLPTDDYKFVKNELIKIPVYESREIAVEDEYNTDNNSW